LKYEGFELFPEPEQAVTRQHPEDRPDASQALELLGGLVDQCELERRVWLRAQSLKWLRFRVQYFGAPPFMQWTPICADGIAMIFHFFVPSTCKFMTIGTVDILKPSLYGKSHIIPFHFQR
jgi:hypothetical protein